MVEVRSKLVSLASLFESQRGNSKYTKAYVNSNSGDFEVYTGSTKTSFGFIDTYDYDEPHLTYTTDGEYAGTLDILEGKYNVGGHRAILFSKAEKLSLAYCKYTFQTLFYNSVKRGDVPSLTWSRIKDEKVAIPIDGNGDFDLAKQEEIVRQFELVESRKAELAEKIEQIKTVEVDVLSGEIGESNSIPFLELFPNLKRGKVISKKTIRETPGAFPVYSTQVNAPLGYIDNYMYDGDYLIWNTDGLGGYIRRVSGKFSITNIVGIMELNPDYAESVDLDYIKLYLEPIFRSAVKGRAGENGKNEYTKLNSTMISSMNLSIPFPLMSDGRIDLEKQHQIVANAQLISQMKQEIESQGHQFIQSNLNFNPDGIPYIYI